MKLSFLLTGLIAVTVWLDAAPVTGWLTWRGPHQNGTSDEKGLPTKIDGAHPLWKVSFPGQSTPVVANGKIYVVGYLGEGPDLQEGVGCFDAETGVKLWEQRNNDFLSDTIYLRYATSSPAIDAETGNVYVQGTQGILSAYTGEGKLLWQHSMMETFGRLTFPNSRTASPIVDGDLVIARGITANWGAQGAAGDRFYAFDKTTGEIVWVSSPGDRPRDNSFSSPYLSFANGKRVFYSATGDGSIVSVNARTGDPIWRIPLFKAGINATVLVHNNDKVIAIYGTPYEPGQMVALKIPQMTPTNAAAGPIIVERGQTELWANELSTSTSSPILVGDRIFVVSEKGNLCGVDANTGKILWKEQIGIEQRNACLVYADGKLYVPILDDPQTKTEGGESGARGALYVFNVANDAHEQLSHTALEGRCFGTPIVYNGKVYIQTTRQLYAFGKSGDQLGKTQPQAVEKWPKAGVATQLQIIPSEVNLHPGKKASFRIRSLDENGFVVADIPDVKSVLWSSYIPPTARVKSTMKGKFNEAGELVASLETTASAGAFEARLGDLVGHIRGRVLPGLPFTQDFESFALTETTTNSIEVPTQFSYPPLPWIGARFKFDVRDKDGNKTLLKTIDNKFFQRGTVFMGTSDMKNYTIQADVMSEGNKRKMSEVGIINQRYIIVLKGNDQKLEINSNLERLRVPATEDASNFKWSPNTWYRLKARVDILADGSGVVRAKAWKREDPEPEAWGLEVRHKTAHKNGSPGLYGFAPQDMKVAIDNVVVTPN